MSKTKLKQLDDSGTLKLDPKQKIENVKRELKKYQKVKALLKELLTVRRLSNSVTDRESLKVEIIENDIQIFEEKVREIESSVYDVFEPITGEKRKA